MHAAIQIDSWLGGTFGKVDEQFTSNFTGLHATSDVIEQQSAGGEPVACETSYEQPIGQIRLGSFHNPEFKDPALLISKK